MTTNDRIQLLDRLNVRFEAFENLLTRPANTLIFLVIRFVLMSGMVVGFSWWSLQLST